MSAPRQTAIEAFSKIKVPTRADVWAYLKLWLEHPETLELEHPQTIRAARIAVRMLGGPVVRAGRKPR